MKLGMPIACLALLGACASQLPPVSVLNRAPKRSCASLGRVEGQGTSTAEARADLRYAAREVGADTVVIDEPLDKLPAGRTGLRGQALRCTEPAASEQSSGAEEVAAAAPELQPSLEERLRELKKLNEDGLITEEEYAQRRQELLQEL